MKKLLIILIFPSFLFAQDGAFRYFVSFKNKANSTVSIEFPKQFLSEKTISKRLNLSIPIDSADLPVNKEYISVLASLGFTIENKSKWFNGVVVSTFDNLLVESLNHQFIDTVISFGSWHNSKIVGEKHIKSVLIGKDGSTIKSIAFNATESDLGGYLLKKNNKSFNIAGKLSLNEWKGQSNVEIIIDDISVNKTFKNTVPSSIG